MAKTDTLNELKNILEDKSASDSVVLRLFISTFVDYMVEEGERKDDQKTINEQVEKNTKAIDIINEWKKAFDKIVWEILKPPLKFVGLSVFVVLAFIGGWLVLR